MSNRLGVFYVILVLLLLVMGAWWLYFLTQVGQDRAEYEIQKLATDKMHATFLIQSDPQVRENPRAYLGPSFPPERIEAWLQRKGYPYSRLDDDAWAPALAKRLAGGEVLGLFQGRMEFGPRALGARSILGDPRSSKMQSVMNLKIKYRESFRPFAPAVKADKVSDWFEHDRGSPYMLMVAPVSESKRITMTTEQQKLFGLEKLHVPRSEIPAVTHVDYSARVQTVHEETNPRFYRQLDEFERQTGCPMSVNTSFNVRGEPIVMSPADAYRCFMRTEMDFLVLENFLLSKADQPAWAETDDWQSEFDLD